MSEDNANALRQDAAGDVAPDTAPQAVPDAAALARAGEDFRRDLLAAIPALRGFARGLCGNRDLADDLAQDALAKAWAARDSYMPGTHFRAWLFRILRNNYFSLGRRAHRFAPWDEALADRVLVTAATQGSGIDIADVQRGLATLPAEQREALLLVSASGLSIEEAAQVMGCAIGTVKSRVSRGRAALNLYMNGATGEPEPARPVAA
nr:sigma-70 family RNA polymerase sigma factor [Polymorphobacter sp.]